MEGKRRPLLRFFLVIFCFLCTLSYFYLVNSRLGYLATGVMRREGRTERNCEKTLETRFKDISKSCFTILDHTASQWWSPLKSLEYEMTTAKDFQLCIMRVLYGFDIPYKAKVTAKFNRISNAVKSLDARRQSTVRVTSSKVHELQEALAQKEDKTQCATAGTEENPQLSGYADRFLLEAQQYTDDFPDCEGKSEDILKLVNLGSTIARKVKALVRPKSEPQAPPPQSDVPVGETGTEVHDVQYSKPVAPPSKFDNIEDFTDPEHRRAVVVDAMMFGWESYKTFAWGFDELCPISFSGRNWYDQPYGTTIVDSLSTLIIMGLTKEVELAVRFISNLDMAIDNYVSFFETSIRQLGGLLSAYELSAGKYPILLEKAEYIGRRLLASFYTDSGMPDGEIELKTGRHTTHGLGLAMIGSSILEFRKLSMLTGDSEFDSRASHVMAALEMMQPKDGFLPQDLHPSSLRWSGKHTLGADADSYYEYLLKEYLMTGKRNVKKLANFRRVASTIMTKLIHHDSNGRAFLSQYRNGYREDGMEHLECFAGGMFALAYMESSDGTSSETSWDTPPAEWDEQTRINDAPGVGDDLPNHGQFAFSAGRVGYLEAGYELTRTCHFLYNRSATGLGAEYSTVMSDGSWVATRPMYVLRPETVESYFYMWRATKDTRWRDYGWSMLKSLIKHCRTEGGFSGINDVNEIPASHNDKQESFLFAETFKYLYLLFSDDSALDLTQWVFNTEAHPLKINSSYVMLPETILTLNLTLPEDHRLYNFSWVVKNALLQQQAAGQKQSSSSAGLGSRSAFGSQTTSKVPLTDAPVTVSEAADERRIAELEELLARRQRRHGPPAPPKVPSAGPNDYFADVVEPLEHGNSN